MHILQAEKQWSEESLAGGPLGRDEKEKELGFRRWSGSGHPFML